MSEAPALELSVEQEIQSQIDADIERHTAERDRYDKESARLTELRDSYDEESDEYAEHHRRLIRAINNATAITRKISQLTHPSELEARVAKQGKTQARIHKLRRNAAMAKTTARDEGVPDVYLNEAGNFLIGKDARYKSDLVLSALGEISADAPGDSLMQFEAKDAEERLAKRDWSGFLERKRQLVTEKAAKADARAKEREEKARVAADAKAAKQKEKDEAKAAKEAERKAAAEAKAASSSSTSSSNTSTSKTDQARAQREAKAEAAGVK